MTSISRAADGWPPYRRATALRARAPAILELEIDRERLPADDQLNYDLFKMDLDDRIEGATYRPELMPVNRRSPLAERATERIAHAAARLGVEVFHDMKEGLKDADVVMMLRLQRERMNGSFVPSVKEYFRFYGLDREKLALAKPDALVMHPGPMNRGVEMVVDPSELPGSVILQQVSYGIAVRMAILSLAMGSAEGFSGEVA